MRDYRIIKVRVRVRYLDNGQSEWFEADLDPDCRDVVIGLDAAGIAGSYDPPRQPRLLEPIPEPEFEAPLEVMNRDEAVRSVSTRKQQAKSAAEPTGSTQYQMMSTTTTSATTTRLPDSCQYINGRWYCWIDAT